MGWILETNRNMNRAMEAMGGRIVAPLPCLRADVGFRLGRPNSYILSVSARTQDLKASPPMFKSPWLDRLTRVHPAVPVLLYLPVIVVLFVTGAGRLGFGYAVALALGGYATWTLTEYWLHRIVFHFEPEEGIGARLHWMIHGVHHDHPNDPLRLVMPPSASVPLAVAFLRAVLARAGRGRRDGVRRRLPRRLPRVRHGPLPRAPPPPATAWGASCASCTCATTSRTTSAGSA